MSEREKFEADFRATYTDSQLSLTFDDSDDRYANLIVQTLFEGWQMRAKAGLSAEQIAAIDAAVGALKYMGGIPRSTDDILAVGNNAGNAAWAQTNIDTLRSLTASPSQEQEAE